MADDDDQPATKGDVRASETLLRGEMRQLGDELRGELNAMEHRLLLEIGQALNVAVEQIGGKVSVIDEKYQDIPARVTALERDVAALKRRPPPAAPRTRRTSRTK